MITIKEIRTASGMSITDFARYFGIPYRTVQNWEREERKCPDYLIELIRYKLENEGYIKKEKEQ